MTDESRVRELEEQLAKLKAEHAKLMENYDGVKGALALYALQSEVVLENLGISPVKLRNVDTATIPDIHSALGVNLKYLEAMAKDYAVKNRQMREHIEKLKAWGIRSDEDAKKLVQAVLDTLEKYSGVSGAGKEVKDLQERNVALETRVVQLEGRIPRLAAAANRALEEARRYKASQARYKGLYNSAKRRLEGSKKRSKSAKK